MLSIADSRRRTVVYATIATNFWIMLSGVWSIVNLAMIKELVVNARYIATNLT